jgi:homoaconitase/3-isopropylmalate dehydratase large subunit
MHLDGVFIGACTTTEEDRVLAALFLQDGLKRGLLQAKGRKHVVPGSLPLLEKLRSLGLLEVYEPEAKQEPNGRLIGQ